jgi:hypothetical protein
MNAEGSNIMGSEEKSLEDVDGEDEKEEEEANGKDEEKQEGSKEKGPFENLNGARSRHSISLRFDLSYSKSDDAAIDHRAMVNCFILGFRNILGVSGIFNVGVHRNR